MSKKRMKNKPHKKTYKKKYCAPSNDKYANKSTCYTSKKLMKMRTYWNKRHPDAMIKSRDPKIIWSELKKNMQNVCNTEQCWLKQKFLSESSDNDLLNYTFAPESPKTWKKNPNEWLTSVDIENVMRQYERAYPNFQFLGPSPIDFDKRKYNNNCVWDELCHFNLRKLMNKGCNKIGIIFNTDPHYLDGSHWIALFIDVKNKYIFFFDSVGDPAPKEIDVLIKRIIQQFNNMNIDVERIDNNISHQKLNTECGMYCLYFIINSIDKKFSNNIRIKDKDMEKFRNVYFYPENK